jgi:hypothetical protein
MAVFEFDELREWGGGSCRVNRGVDRQVGLVTCEPLCWQMGLIAIRPIQSRLLFNYWIFLSNTTLFIHLGGFYITKHYQVGSRTIHVLLLLNLYFGDIELHKNNKNTFEKHEFHRIHTKINLIL